MGLPRQPDEALLFVATLWPEEECLLQSLPLLEQSFGEIAMESPSLRWDFSDYYREELGEPLSRKFLFFRKLIDPGDLAQIKLKTNTIENSLARDGRRGINIDPGYLTPAKIILASTKDYSHRIYLRDGIYGEVTLIFRKGAYVPHLNTYRDYRDERYHHIFMLGRTLLSLLAHTTSAA
jgi:hypothetical protein